LFEILHSKNLPNLFLKSITEIYSGNKMKLKINNQSSEEHTSKHGVRQGCPLPPTLFNIYINVRIVKWNHVYIKGVTLSTSTKINTHLFMNDQVITADSEDNLQTEFLHCKTWRIEMEISPEQSEMMAFSGQDPVRYKVTVDNKSLQQLKNTLNVLVVTFPMKM
jgi:hypothetical protein